MKNDFNSDNFYCIDIDSNFKNACILYDKEFSHSELIELLKNGNIIQKQISAIKLKCVYNQEEVKILINNLTGCDGKIREAVALKIYTLLNISDNCKQMFADVAPLIFAEATIDINANICRLVVDSACLLKNYDNFAIVYSDNLMKLANTALDELDKFIFRDKKYVINKQIFKLYWCLEGLKYFYGFVDKNAMDYLLFRCLSVNEYTIREKIAQIVIQTGSHDKIIDILKNDENYYVRQVFKSS